MRILHYSLGFPPYRRGGLTKYCMDTMKEESSKGHDVAMLWPGDMGLLREKAPQILERKSHHIGSLAIRSFEFQGCLPVPLLEGVSDPNEYAVELAIKPFESFIATYKPDVVHFHTIMGFPKNYLLYLKASGIKTLFTSHDYYGICPRTTLIKGIENCTDLDCNCCAQCNANATSVKKIKILQSGIYRVLKDTAIIRALRKQHWKKSELSVKDCSRNSVEKKDTSNKYEMLRRYYIEMLELFDVIHFNSKNTQQIYNRYSDRLNGTVRNISHAHIADNRKKRTRHSICHFTYLGPETYHKGYYLLLEVCDKLWNDGYRFKLNIYFKSSVEKPYIITHMPYRYEDLAEIMDNTDYLVVPSLWNETYGFTVPEAMSYAIPAIVSTTVGAKDEILSGINGIVVAPTLNDLYDTCVSVIDDSSIFEKYNINICERYYPRTMSEHCQALLELYK